MGKRKLLHTAAILLVWLLIWQAAAMWIHNRIIFVGPAEVCHVLLELLKTPEFWRTVLYSSVRIGAGYLLAFSTALLIGAAACRWGLLGEFLEPAMVFLQSVPVASFVILALIWIGSENLAVLICFIVVFPVIYRNTIQGVRAADTQMLEMAQVFRMSRLNRMIYIYRPALMPYLISACRVALGMAWKSGVAAEVIGIPGHSIGERLYMAKIYLSTGELFAWTLVIIVVSKLFERMFLGLLSLADIDRKHYGNDQRRSGS